MQLRILNISHESEAHIHNMIYSYGLHSKCTFIYHFIYVYCSDIFKR